MTSVVPSLSRFVRCRQLLPGESLPSFVQWHCTENVVPKLSVLYALLARRSGTSIRSIHEVTQSPSALRALEHATRQQEGALNHLSRKVLRGAVEGGYETRLVEGAYEWPEHARARRLQPVCPLCLSEASHALTCWEFVQAPVCLRHQVGLVDHCDDCGAPIVIERLGLLRCMHCGRHLSHIKPKPADDIQVEAARWVQASKTWAFGSPEDNLPVEPHDLSGFLRLLLHPEPGQQVNFGLTGDLEAVSIEPRLAALGRLGQVLEGNRIDATRLLEAVIRRWLYADLLPNKAFGQLLREACSVVALPRDVTEVLCGSDEALGGPPAVELFKPGQPPRIFKLESLANRLGLSKDCLQSLMAEEGVSAVKPAHYGFDMDDVLRLERAISAMPTLEQADELLGWPGLAAELLSMRLLTGFTLARGEKVIHPRSPCSLFERAQESQVVRPAETDIVATLGAAASARGLDGREVAWALWRMLSGSVSTYGWEAPYCLTSLLVCTQDLQPREVNVVAKAIP